MRVTTHKLDAKRVISEFPSRSRFAALVCLLPRTISLSMAGLLIYFYHDQVATVFALIFSVVSLLFLLNSILIPAGNLLLCSLMFEEVLSTNTNENFKFKTAISLLRQYGFIKLIKLRIAMLVRIVKDSALGVLPPLLLAAGILLYFATRPMPIGAAISLAIGILLMTILAVARILIEYSKYNFVYLHIFLYGNPDEDIKSIFIESIYSADLRIKSIFIMEMSFLAREVYSGLLILPLLYLTAYKKLTLFSIGEAEPAPHRKSAYEKICERYTLYSRKQKEIKKIHMSDTIVFDLKEE